ncbi:hypothetical protein P43SY_001854 [Pythium insidiosum]|uniref:Rab-GAP TBC domain-containing protein n=1 Tax=Pythium insidiosum TaxID=114742 RepID=A0AAD5Q5L6_PYTIN|nr:hypothetical protein P43SY_001854 [Pythium insidiosum]
MGRARLMTLCATDDLLDAATTDAAAVAKPKPPLPPPAACVHGRRLSCLRPRERFACSRWWTALPAGAACHCETPVFPCRLASSSSSPSPAADGNSSNRRKRWLERLERHDWERLERVCQRWKERARGGSEPPTPERLSLSSWAETRLWTNRLDALVRGGVPAHLRGRVWWMCSGAASRRAAAAPYETYAALLPRLPLLSKRDVLEIEKDLPRTFPQDNAAAVDDPSERRRLARQQHELRRVLQAYCLRNPTIGYCQSMNFLGAVLLQHLEEEEAFWVLVAMLEDLLPQFHSHSMLGSRAELRVFTDLVHQKLPTLAQHLQALGVDLAPVTPKWFLCLFLNTLPLTTVLRIWDVFFCEGSHVLVRVGLTLLKLREPEILGCDDVLDVYALLKFSDDALQALTAPHRSTTFSLHRDECVCDTLLRLAMDKSFLGPIASDTLEELRLFYRNEVIEELKSATAGRRRENDGVDGEEMGDEDNAERGRRRYAEADQELAEYDFVQEYSYHTGDVSPTKHIEFDDDDDDEDGDRTHASSSSSSDSFITVDYTGSGE